MPYKANFNQQKTFSKDPTAQLDFHSKEKWWTPVWNGLPVDPSSKHYKAMRSSLWLYLYFLIYANRYSGILFRKTSTIARDMGLNSRTVSRWLSILRQNGYIETRRTGHALEISITKWKSIKK